MKGDFMIKKSLISSIGVSIGIMIGKYLLPKIFSTNSYNDIYSLNWKQFPFDFVIAYVTTFLVYLALNWIKSKN